MDSKELKAKIEDRLTDGNSENGLRKTDMYKSLECFCSDNPPNNDFERSVRGYIFDDDKLILKSLPYPYVFKFKEEKSSDENFIDNTNNIYDKDFIGEITDYECTLLKEGTAIRVFYYNDEWFTTTHRKLNAFKSKWGKESFGEIFEENIKIKTGKPLNEFYNTLNKEYNYVFLVGTTETTRTVSPKYNNVYLLNVMDKNHNIIFYEPLKEWYQQKQNFKTLEEAIDFVESLQYPFEDGCGLFLHSKNKNFKIINTHYEELSELRYNLPSIPFAYLHNVFDETKRKKFRELYPEFKSDFDFYDSEIKAIALDIQIKYFKRFAKKEEIVVSKQEHNILYNLHGEFLRTRIPIKIENVIEVFKTLPISNVNKIISERKRQKKLFEKNCLIKL